MNYIDLVKQNELLIEKFDINLYKESKSYAYVGILAALEATNELQKYYLTLNEENKEIGESLINLYGFLQSLFVSIDALYSLTYLITNNKNYLNINANKVLRNLRFIRNDVVGHPANRSRNYKDAYCVLNKESIKTFRFSYTIYSQDNIDLKEVDLFDLISNYYKEANIVLENLYHYSKKNINNNLLINKIKDIINEYPNNYLDNLDILINSFIKKHDNKDLSSSRIMWYYNIINILSDINHQDNNLNNYNKDIIYFFLTKIYNILSNKKFSSNNYKYSKLTKNIIKIIKSKKGLINNLKILSDINHPYFKNIYNKFLNELYKNSYFDSYVTYLNKLVENKNYEVFYAYLFVLKLI